MRLSILSEGLNKMKLHVSFKARIKQLFCSHNGKVVRSCCSQGINSKEGYWYMDYQCLDCGFSYGEWIKADRNQMELLFKAERHKIK